MKPRDVSLGIITAITGIFTLSVSPLSLAEGRINLIYRPAIIHELESTDSSNAPSINPALLPPFEILKSEKDLPNFTLPTASFAGPDPLVDQDWSIKSINLPSQLNFNPSPVTVAVIDTGVDYNHEDLAPAMWRHPANPQEVGYDFAHHIAKPFDVVHFNLQGCIDDPMCTIDPSTQASYLTNPGHGTHCAGHVGAVANNSRGIRGVGQGARIMALKFFFDHGDAGEGGGDDQAAIEAIDYAIQNGAKVISASWGGRHSRALGEKSELKAAILRARAAGVLFVVAAGNGDEMNLGIDQDKNAMPVYPAAYELDNMIVVAASDAEDHLGKFSNYGKKSVHLAAPGVKIFSTVVGDGYSDAVASAEKNGKTMTEYWNGTSMATPLVAGAAALLWSKHPEAGYREVRAKLLANVRKVPGLDSKISSGGVLDVGAALKNW